MKIIKIKGQYLEVHDPITVHSFEQFDYFIGACKTVSNLPVSAEDRMKQTLNLFPLFCAFHLQPLRDGYFEIGKVHEIWDELKTYQDKESVESVATNFVFAVANYVEQNDPEKFKMVEKELIEFLKKTIKST